MSEFLGDMLRNEAPAPAEAEPTPAPEPIQEQVNEQRDAALDQLAATAPEPASQPTPEPEASREDQRVPLATFLDKRDEARELKRRLEAYEAREREQQSNAMPDPFDDPAGYDAAIEQRMDQRLTQQRFAMSETMAVQQHGAEKVSEAVQWAQSRAQQDPAFAGAYMRQQHPIDWIVQQHKQDQLLADIGGNVDDWFVREAAKRGYAAVPAPTIATAPTVAAAQPAIKPAAPPRSIASDLSPAPAVTPEGDKEGFLAAFTRK